MRKFTVFFILLSLLSVVAVKAQQGLDNSKIRQVALPMPAEQMIQRVAKKETDFASARNQYLYRQEVTVNTLGIANVINGQYYRLSEVVFDDTGKRSEKILKMPPQNLVGLEISNEDLTGFGAVTPFALTTDQIPNFQITYVGKEKIDELDTFVFDITPKFMIPLLDKI
jgi:hypothetical protein